MKKSASERAKAYRARCKAIGIEPTRGQRLPAYKEVTFKEVSALKRQFIAIDGEGENYGEEECFSIGNVSSTDFRKYTAQDHKYTLLAASTGDELYDGGRRLQTGACFDFLLDIAKNYPRAIFVIFSGGYDINHMLMHGIPRDQLLRISKGEIVDVELEKADCFETYRIEYRSRKSLSIKSGLQFYQRKNGTTGARYKKSIRLWDVFGFFQENFVSVMKKWLGENHPDYAMIKYMKALRGNFDKLSDKDIQEYNRAELRCLVELMEKVAEAIQGLGLECQRWDGAGAVAGAIFKRQGIKDHKKVTDDDISTAVRTAYSGGRIEACKIGNTDKPIYHYDVNSAYPSVMLNLPCLSCGTWRHVKGVHEFIDGQFAVWRLAYDLPDDLPFYPLFFRNADMSILYPAKGEGWYWNPEAFAANEFAYKFGGNLTVMEGWIYETTCNHQPFKWIKDYYAERQLWIQAPTADWHGGGEKIIKLGLNSLYGKTAQQLGGTVDAPPVYFQMEWAGYITSGTRAALLQAAMQKPYDIISFATDGLFSLSELDLYCPAKKELGAWEFKKHDGMVMVMPGVYWLKDAGKYQHFSRGFDKDQMEHPERIIEAWKKGNTQIGMITRRLIGLGTACGSDTFWKMRGRFVTGERILQLDLGHSQKRQIVNVKKAQLHNRLFDSLPRYNYLDVISRPYPIKWMGDEGDAEYEKEKEEDKEIIDSFNV